MAVDLFTEGFLSAVQSLVQRHHTIYPRLPPQGLFFEAIVEQAFLLSGWAREQIVPATTNSPWHDLLVGGVRLSVKSETGKATKATRINITKLCTTETGEWSAAALVSRAVAHLGRYDRILMLRAIWAEDRFDYQLIEIPVVVLAQMRSADFREVGTRRGRRSFAAHVMDGPERIFRVHFDGADAKCQVLNLLVDRCVMLRTWHQAFDR